MFNETWYLVEGEQPHAGPHFKYPSGRNVLVGLIPWKGFNIEDAIVISRSCSLKFTNKKFIVYKVGIQNCKTIKLIDDERYDEDGIIIEGSYIKKGDILATRYCSTEVNVLDNIKSSMEGIIDKIVRGIHCIRIRVVSENPLKIGDKMTSRHGQKGVVSLILPNEEMPYIKTTDEKIPLDILMNPMSIPSRETMGQILE
ncbi:beta and beta-prime subunits of DNA dependent RNA-polymerase, partial [Ramicandelaber brevisporus]